MVLIASSRSRKANIQNTMQIFLSYASEDRAIAEEIQLALVGSGHDVFFDKASLPAGGDYHSRIQSAVQSADIFIFLITPNSIKQKSYALTELKFARMRWVHPKEKILPVLVCNTAWNLIPPYLKSVTILEPEGNIAAEVLAAVKGLNGCTQPPKSVEILLPRDDGEDGDNAREKRGKFFGSNHLVQILVAVIGLIGALGAAVIAILLTTSSQKDEKPAVAVGMKGPDTATGSSPVLNKECQEITFMDFSKVPPESRIEKRCDP